MINDLPGWETNIDEFSPGIFRVTLTDKYGRKAEFVDNATEETIERAIEYAFDIEKQVSENWNKFLYDYFHSECDEPDIIETEYNEQAFGSWFIKQKKRQIIFDGKDKVLSLQLKKTGKWKEELSFDFDKQIYDNIKRMTKKHAP